MASSTQRYRIMGMDCEHDAHEIETAAGAVEGVQTVRVSVVSQVMTISLGNASTGAVEQAVNAIGYRIEPVTDADAPTHMTSAYRRALWIVVVLNLGYGVVEWIGGYLSGSQALRADALDFFGDGAITLLGIMAIGWGLAWRARAAMIQGIFLGALGIGVLVQTVIRLEEGYVPEANLMGWFGVGALIANVFAVIVLLPHRAGDSNVKAVWMFSRNDAMGNVAVVIAAGLVALLDTAWPDIVVAFVIAGLFLQSSWSIISDARGDMRR